MVFRQMKNTAIFRNLHIQGHAICKTMLPINRETEKIYIKLFRFCFIKDAQDRCCPSKTHSNKVLPYSIIKIE